MSDIGPEEAAINAHFAAVKAELAALEQGKQYREHEDAVQGVNEVLRRHLPDDTEIDTLYLARRAVNAARPEVSVD